MRRSGCAQGVDDPPSSEMMFTVLTELRIAASSCKQDADELGGDAPGEPCSRCQLPWPYLGPQA